MPPPQNSCGATDICQPHCCSALSGWRVFCSCPDDLRTGLKLCTADRPAALLQCTFQLACWRILAVCCHRWLPTQTAVNSSAAWLPRDGWSIKLCADALCTVFRDDKSYSTCSPSLTPMRQCDRFRYQRCWHSYKWRLLPVSAPMWSKTSRGGSASFLKQSPPSFRPFS